MLAAILFLMRAEESLWQAVAAGAAWDKVQLPQDLSRFRIDYVLAMSDDPVDRRDLEALGLTLAAEGKFGDLYPVDR